MRTRVVEVASGRRPALLAATALVLLTLGALALGYFGAGESMSDARRAAESRGYREGEERGKREGRAAGKRNARAPQSAADSPPSAEDSTSAGDRNPTDDIDPSDPTDCPPTGPLPLERREACGV